MADSSFGFDPLSLTQKADKPTKANAQPASTPSNAIDKQRLNSIMAALVKIKALSEKPQLATAFHEMAQDMKNRVQKDVQQLRNDYQELAKALDTPMIAKIYKEGLTKDKARYIKLKQWSRDFSLPRNEPKSQMKR